MFDPAMWRRQRIQNTQTDASEVVTGRKAPRRLPRVLFVDDDLDLLEGLRLALRKEPLAIETAGSAAQALWTMSRVHVDVVVSDEQMPRVSGSELLSVVRSRFPDTVRIMLTGQASLDAAIRAINHGEVFRFLTKPCTPRQLALTLREALAANRVGRERPSGPQERSHVLAALERTYPGITQVARSADGAIDFEGQGHSDADSSAQLDHAAEVAPTGGDPRGSGTTPWDSVQTAAEALGGKRS